MREPRKLHTPVIVFSLVPHLLFDFWRVLEYAKIRTVLQSSPPLAVVSYGKQRASE